MRFKDFLRWCLKFKSFLRLHEPRLQLSQPYSVSFLVKHRQETSKILLQQLLHLPLNWLQGWLSQHHLRQPAKYLVQCITTMWLKEIEAKCKLNSRHICSLQEICRGTLIASQGLLASGHYVCMLISFVVAVVVVIMMICLYVVVCIGSCLQSVFLLPTQVQPYLQVSIG